MPNIAEYQAANNLIPQPTDMAASTAREVGTVQNRLTREAGDSLGRGIAQLGRPIGEAVDQHLVSQAISHGAAAASSLWANKTQEWNQLAANADPNDHSISDKWTTQSLEPDLQKFQQSFENAPPRAQEWAQRQVDNMRQHFFEKTQADMGTRAGLAAVSNLQDMERNYSHTAADDPSTLGYVRDSLTRDFKSVISSSPYMTADAAARLQNEELPKMLRSVSVSAAVGLGSRQPDQLIKEIGEGKWDQYLTPEEQNRAVESANRFKNQQYITQEHERAQKEQQIKDTAEKAKDEYVTKIGLGQTPAAKDIALDSRLRPEDKENIFAFQERRTAELRENSENAQHPAAFRALSTQMIQASQNGQDFDAKAVQDAYMKGEIGFREFNQLNAVGANMDKPFTKQFNGELLRSERAVNASPWFAAHPEQAAAAVNRMEEDARQTLDQYRQKGQDVRPLLDSTSPQYLFKPSTIAAYMRPQQAMSEAADAARAGAAPKDATGRDTSRVAAGRVNGGPASSPNSQAAKVFADEAAAKAAGLKDGERVTINGVTGTWKN